MQIQIGNIKIPVLSASSTTITVKSVPMGPGLYELKIPAGALGVARLIFNKPITPNYFLYFN
jgi:hypothetical protein